MSYIGYVTEMATLFEGDTPSAVMVKVQTKTMTLLFQDAMGTKFAPGSQVSVSWELLGHYAVPDEKVLVVEEPMTQEQLDEYEAANRKPFSMSAPLPKVPNRGS